MSLISDFITLLSPASLQLGPINTVAMLTIVTAAAIIRGYAGFGFSAIVVASLSLFIPTVEVVPLVLLLEITASLQMARGVWKSVNWKLVTSIMTSSLVFIPLGQQVLLLVAVEPMRVVAALLLLATVALTASGCSFPLPNNPKGWLIIGMVSGFMNGLLAMGGLWVMTFLLGSGVQIATLRASLVALFFMTDIYAALVGLGQGLITQVAFGRFLWSIPFLIIGVRIGANKFDPQKTATYRRLVLSVLAALAVTLLLRSAIAIW